MSTFVRRWQLIKKTVDIKNCIKVIVTLSNYVIRKGYRHLKSFLYLFLYGNNFVLSFFLSIAIGFLRRHCCILNVIRKFVWSWLIWEFNQYGYNYMKKDEMECKSSLNKMVIIYWDYIVDFSEEPKKVLPLDFFYFLTFVHFYRC